MREGERLMWVGLHAGAIKGLTALLAPLRAAGTLRSLLKAREVEAAIRRHEAALEALQTEAKLPDCGGTTEDNS